MKQAQISHATGYMRYAELYAGAKRIVESKRPLKILVFGCSSGLELRTVKHFWDDADIFGCDISDEILLEAKSNASFATIFESSREAILDHGPFDFVAANSVLCRHPYPNDQLSVEFPFRMFVEFTNTLYECLKPGGLLMLNNTNYLVNDLDIYQDLTPIRVPNVWCNGFVPKADKDGNLLARPVTIDSVLKRFHLRKGIDPLETMICSLFKKTVGGELSVDIKYHNPSSSDMDTSVDRVMPDIIGSDIFMPWAVDNATDAGQSIRSLFVSNPIMDDWILHGTYEVKNNER